MSRVVLIRNLTSTRNRSGWRQPVPPRLPVFDCSTPEELANDLATARASGAEVLLIDGGDGTVREVLSRLPEIWGDALPRIGLVPHGNTNLIAREQGALRSLGAAAELLRRIESGDRLTERRMSLLRIDYPAGEHPAVRGSILGWGAYAEGTRMAREEIKGRGSGLVALTVFSLLMKTIVGGEGAKLRQGIEAPLAVDGAALARARSFVGVATTLQAPLAARMNPFWGTGTAPMRWLDIAAPAARLAQAAPYILRGQPARWMERAGYVSGRAHRIELTPSDPVVIDGEIYPAPRSGPLTLSAAESVTFLSL